MAKTLIATATASASSSLSFTSGIDSTYDVYEFHCVNMHPATDGAFLQFQANASGQTGYNEVITSTSFRAIHDEADTVTGLAYHTGLDQAQGTAYQDLLAGVGADNDQSGSGVLTLYNPSSTTYVKHFSFSGVISHDSNYAMEFRVSGYINTTSAIDEIDFKFSSGNIDAGSIHMYGVG